MNYQVQDYLHVSGILKKLDFSDSSFLITGATGLIGSFIVNALHYANNVYHLNNRIIAVVRNEKKAEFLFPWVRNIDSDLGLIVVKDIKDAVPCISVDYIIHAAGNTDSAYMISNPVETSLGIIEGTKNILELSRIVRPQGVAMLSSMEVYGQILEKAVVDETFPFGFIDPFNVRSCYPMAKRMVENLVCSYFSEYHVHAMALRLSQTFGYPVASTEKRLFGMMINAAKQKQDIVLSTKGDKINNFCYLSDAVTAILYVLKKGEAGNCYNVSNISSAMSIVESARMIANDIMEKQIKVCFDISSQSNKKFAPDSKYIMDSSKLESLGWYPIISLYEAYKRNIIDYVSSDQ